MSKKETSEINAADVLARLGRIEEKLDVIYEALFDEEIDDSYESLDDSGSGFFSEPTTL